MRRPRAVRPRGIAGLGRETFAGGSGIWQRLAGLADGDDRTELYERSREALFLCRKCARFCSKIRRAQHHYSDVTRLF
jgi:hypothetical protein